jgi:hypothetical protein
MKLPCFTREQFAALLASDAEAKNKRTAPCSMCGTAMHFHAGIGRAPRYCQECKASPEFKAARRPGTERMRKYLATYRARFPEKRRAQGAVANAIRAGKLVRRPCAVCAADPSEAHHDDYSKPLDVRWLCRRCHKAHHRIERQGGIA